MGLIGIFIKWDKNGQNSFFAFISVSLFWTYPVLAELWYRVDELRTKFENKFSYGKVMRHWCFFQIPITNLKYF